MSKVIPLPTAVHPPSERLAAMSSFSGLVQELAHDALSESFDFAVAEQRLHEAVSELERVSLTEVLAAAQPAAERVVVNGVVFRQMASASTGAYLTRVGTVHIERPLYRQFGVRNGPTIDPIALRCGLVQGRLTPAAAASFAHLAQALPSREAVDLCQALGVLPYSRSALQRNGQLVGAAWNDLAPEVAEDMAHALTIPEEAVSVSVAVDRVSLPMAEDRPHTPADLQAGVKRPITVQSRMAYCAVWTLHDAKGEPLHSVRYAHIPDGGPASIQATLADDLNHLFLQRPTLQLVTLADGAPELQNLLDRVVAGRPVTEQLVDFWHLAEKLAAAGSSTGRPGRATTRRFAHQLFEDDEAIEQIEAELFGWASAYADATLPEALYEALTYIDNQRERLRYASAKAAGLPIGSGHVEATCKTIVSVRFKRSGARWRPHGAQPLLRLRALATSSCFPTAMRLLTRHATAIVREAA